MNTFGTATLKFPLCDVDASRARFCREALPLLARVNTFESPLGRRPARGCILLPRSEYAQLNSYSTALQLELDQLTLKNLAIVRARCATRGLLSDPAALYLVELTDGRGTLTNEWFQHPVDVQYNVRSPAYQQQYYSLSLNGGVAWTWSTMVGDLWSKMPVLGAYGGLPTAPAGTPEGWQFSGVSAWHALCDVLDSLGLAVAHSPASAAPYSVVYTGATDASFAALQQLYVGSLQDDLEWLDTGSGRAPGVVIVYFRYRAYEYGQEETVRGDERQWSSAPLYPVSVPAPAQFAGAVGTHFLRDDFTVRRDHDNAPLAADVATAATIAAERAAQYFARIQASMSQTYSGALPFSTGAQVDCVRWYRDDGWKTNVSRGRQ